jgi:hypothetical protein
MKLSLFNNYLATINPAKMIFKKISSRNYLIWEKDIYLIQKKCLISQVKEKQILEEKTV